MSAQAKEGRGVVDSHVWVLQYFVRKVDRIRVGRLGSAREKAGLSGKEFLPAIWCNPGTFARPAENEGGGSNVSRTRFEVLLSM